MADAPGVVHPPVSVGISPIQFDRRKCLELAAGTCSKCNRAGRARSVRELYKHAIQMMQRQLREIVPDQLKRLKPALRLMLRHLCFDLGPSLSNRFLEQGEEFLRAFNAFER
jgi:hypothetical protein